MRMVRLLPALIMGGSVVLMAFVIIDSPATRTRHFDEIQTISDWLKATVAFIQLGAAFIIASLFAAQAFGDERRDGVLPLLELASRSPEELFAVKLTRVYAPVLLTIASCLPLQAVNAAFGGVGLLQILLQFGVMAYAGLCVCIICLALAIREDRYQKHLASGFGLMFIWGAIEYAGWQLYLFSLIGEPVWALSHLIGKCIGYGSSIAGIDAVGALPLTVISAMAVPYALHHLQSPAIEAVLSDRHAKKSFVERRILRRRMDPIARLHLANVLALGKSTNLFARPGTVFVVALLAGNFCGPFLVVVLPWLMMYGIARSIEITRATGGLDLLACTPTGDVELGKHIMSAYTIQTWPYFVVHTLGSSILFIPSVVVLNYTVRSPEEFVLTIALLVAYIGMWLVDAVFRHKLLCALGCVSYTWSQSRPARSFSAMCAFVGLSGVTVFFWGLMLPGLSSIANAWYLSTWEAIPIAMLPVGLGYGISIFTSRLVLASTTRNFGPQLLLGPQSPP